MGDVGLCIMIVPIGHVVTLCLECFGTSNHYPQRFSGKEVVGHMLVEVVVVQVLSDVPESGLVQTPCLN